MVCAHLPACLRAPYCVSVCVCASSSLNGVNALSCWQSSEVIDDSTFICLCLSDTHAQQTHTHTVWLLERKEIFWTRLLQSFYTSYPFVSFGEVCRFSPMSLQTVLCSVYRFAPISLNHPFRACRLHRFIIIC